VAALAGAASAGLLCGCASDDGSPFARQSQRQLERAIVEEAERELQDAKGQPLAVVTTREPGMERMNIRQDLMQELQQMAGPESYLLESPDLGVDLTGRGVRTVSMSLERAIQTAVQHNFAVQFVRLSPAVSEAQLQAAEGAFDWTLFSNLNYTVTDSPRVTVNNFSSADQSQAITGNAGLRRQLIGGGRLTIQGDSSYTDNDSPGQTNVPNPAAGAQLSLQWDQPLLRNFGSEVSQAEIRLARNRTRDSVQQMRRDLLRTVSETERNYWQLVQARQDLLILQRLLDRGEAVRKQLLERARIDANSAQIADATARVERRRSDVLRAQTQVQIISDRLKTLMNDPQLPVGSEVVALPSDLAVDAPIKFSLLESLRTAIGNRPEVQQAIFSIDDASIRQIVADNQRLPNLDLRLQTRFASLDNEVGRAYDDVLDGNFIDYLAGLAFEVPLGNRRPEAQLRQRRLERMQSVISYRNVVQQVVGDVKSSLYRIKQNYSLIEQTRASRVAASENVRVLLVEKEQGLGYTVERLSLELDRQEQLANAEREEVAALADYNSAIADLFAAMGVSLERNNIALRVEGPDEPFQTGFGKTWFNGAWPRRTSATPAVETPVVEAREPSDAVPASPDVEAAIRAEREAERRSSEDAAAPAGPSSSELPVPPRP
jgi:outer membrane protein